MNDTADNLTGPREVIGQQVERRRWVVVLGGFFLSLMGGMSYAWGSFTVPLINDWGFIAAQATLPFTVLIMVFAVVMIPAGRLQDRIGPRKVATAGALLFLVGYSLAALLRYIPSPTWLVLSYGVVVGAACGLTYACVAPTARKWYPDRPGLAVSCGVMGFGLAAVVFAPLKATMIEAWGVDGTLFVLGLIVAAGAFIGARLVRNPPVYWSPPPRTSVSSKPQSKSAASEDVPPGKVVRTWEFYLMWLALAAVIGGGLTAIGLITAFGQLGLQLRPAVAAVPIAVYSLVNGLGRPFVGWFADRIGTIRVMVPIYAVQAVVFLAIPWVATNLPLLIMCSLLLGMGYAVTFALFPVLVATRFGVKHLGINYGLVFCAFGIGAITGLLGSWLLDSTGSFTPAFLLAGITTVIGLILLIVLNKKFGLT